MTLSFPRGTSALSPLVAMEVAQGLNNLAVDDDRTSIIVSNWTLRATPVDNNWINVVWSPEQRVFCAVANNTTGTDHVMTSPDGRAWTSQTTSTAAWTGLCWAKELGTSGLFVATAESGSATTRAMTSPTGETWATHTTPGSDGQQWRNVCWSPELSLLVAVANSDTASTHRVMTSPDGITWTLRTTIDEHWHDVIWVKELGLFVSCSIDIQTYPIMTSPDGINWTPRAAGVGEAGLSSGGWQSITWSPQLGKLVAVSNVGVKNRAMTSSDGINWTVRTTPATVVPGFSNGYNNSWHDVQWAPALGLFVAIANTGHADRIMTSPDGISWTLRQSAYENSWECLAWSPELRIMVGVAESEFQPSLTGYHAMTSLVLG